MHTRTTLITLAATALMLGTLLFLLPTPVGDPAAAATSPDGNRWVIENVSVFDGERLLPPDTLVLADGKILAADAAVPRAQRSSTARASSPCPD